MKTRQAGGTRGSYRDVISRCRRWYIRLGSLEADLEMRIHVQEIHEEVLSGGTLREAQKQDKGREDTSKCAMSSQVLVKEASLLFPQGTLASWLLLRAIPGFLLPHLLLMAR